MRGKEQVNISTETQHQKLINEARSKDLVSSYGIIPDIIVDNEFNEEDDDANADLTKAYYDDNKDAIPLSEIVTTKDGSIGLKVKVDRYGSKRKEGKVLINQSLVKKIIDKFHNEKEFCPKYIKDICIDKKATITNEMFFESKVPEMESMMKGKFFESLAIGSTTSSDLVLDLPRSKRKSKMYGTKTLDQVRIENQAERFKMRCKQLQVDIVPGHNVHMQIFKRWSDKYMIAGELDIFPVAIYYEEALRLAMIDLKLTADVNSTFGPFSWGDPKNMDHIQADMYHYLIRDVDFEVNPHLKDIFTDRIQQVIKNNEVLFLYWVFGYKEPLDNQERLIERTYGDEHNPGYKQGELKERIRKTIAVLEREEQFGWEEKPVQESCRLCPLSQRFGGNCKSSIVFKV